MKHLLTALIVIAFASCTREHSDLKKVAIIPKPVSVEAMGSFFELTNESTIYIDRRFPDQTGVQQACEQLASRLRAASGFQIEIKWTDEVPPAGNIFIEYPIRSKAPFRKEEYELVIGSELIHINAEEPDGVFYAFQTLRQLFPPQVEGDNVQSTPWKIATGVIRDYPKYAWRGSMLDVARHFFSVDDVKRYIDLISAYKMNVLHLHLSDDQGWRIEIKSWPNLTSHGGSTAVGGGTGGFYTQEQYKEIVAYAQSRFVTIVPEIDLPGHINSALASYGELNGGTIVPAEGAVKITEEPILGEKNKPTPLYTSIEVGWSTLRFEKESTFRFVGNVIRELSTITPGPYFHIGGDEAAATKKDDYIKFINRFREIVTANHKIMVGWEEIAQGNIDSAVVTQYWNQEKYALLAIDKKSRLVMSPAKKAYLDMSYDSTSRLGLHWAAFIEVDAAYNWNPTTFLRNISDENMIGVEAPLWSETISTMDQIEYMAFPRLPGYAEIAWSPEENRNWNEYRLRLATHGKRMEEMRIDFYRSPKVPWDSVVMR